MKSFTLIFKNNWYNVKKLKGAFVLLFLIIVFFSTVFSLFWEFNRQFSTNINNLNLDSNKVDFEEDKIQQPKTVINAFCTDYTEIYDKEKKLKRRLPILSFGGENGCFKSIKFEDIEFDYELSSSFNKLNKNFRILRIKNINISNTALKVNEKSIFYQKSIHGLLIKKYFETGKIDFLNSAHWLENNYFNNILKFYKLKLQAYLNQKLKENPIYTSLKTSSKLIGIATRKFISSKLKFNVFQKFTNLISAHEKLKILDKRADEFANTSNIEIIKTNFKFYFQNIIENIISFLKSNDFKNSILKQKYLNILIQPQFDWKTLNPMIRNKNLIEQGSVVIDKQNLIYLVKLINEIIQKKDNQFFVANFRNPSFHKIVRYLMNFPKQITFDLKKIFFKLFPIFELYLNIKNAFENYNYGNDRKESLKIFNYKGQTLTELWESKKFNILEKKIILELISSIQSKYEAIVRFKNFKSNQTELIKLEQILFGNQKKSVQILSTKNSFQTDILIRNYFDRISIKIQNLKSKFIKYKNFYGLKNDDIPIDQKPKFYFYLTNGFQLNNIFFKNNRDHKTYFNEMITFINTANALIQKIIERGLSTTNNRNWIANTLKAKTAEDLDKIINQFNNLVDPNIVFHNKWRFFKNWIRLFLIQKLIIAKPRETANDAGNRLDWDQLLDSNTFIKFFTYFINGLETLSKDDYLEFQNHFINLKTENLNQEKQLLMQFIDQMSLQDQNQKLEIDTPDLKFKKNFSWFKINLQNNSLDEFIKKNPGYLFWKIIDRMYTSTAWVNSKISNTFNSNINYLESAYSKIVYLTNWIYFLPPSQSTIDKLIGNYTAIKNFLIKIRDDYNNLINNFIPNIRRRVYNFYFYRLPLEFYSFKRIELLSQTQKPTYLDGKLIKDLKTEVNELVTPPILKHWFNKFGNGNSPFINPKIVFDTKNKVQFIDLLLKNNNQFDLFEKSQKLLSQPLPGYETFTQSIVTQPILTSRAVFFNKIKNEYVKIFNSLLPDDLKDKFTIKKIAPHKKIEIIDWNSQLLTETLQVNNVKTEFLTPYFYINFAKVPDINVDKIIYQANQQFETYIKNVFLKTNAGTELIFGLTNWDNQKFFYSINYQEANKPTKDLIESHNQKFDQIYASVFGMKINFLRYIFSQEKKYDRSILIIANSDNLKVVLHEGYKPKKLNEVIISPFFAAKNKIKVGDNISIFNIDNFKVTGLGTSKEFAYPSLSYINLIPRSKDNVIFVHPKIINRILKELKLELNSNFYINKKLIYYVFDNYKFKKEIFHKYYSYNMLKSNEVNFDGYKNYSQFSESLFTSLQKDYQISDENFNSFQKGTVQLPIKFNIAIPNVIYKTVFYVFIYVIVILFLIAIFSIWHLLSKKIEINRWQLGVLKAFGFSNLFLLTSLLSFVIFLILGVFCGWIIGTILQKPFFNLFSDKIIFQFDYFYFNHISFYLCLSIVIFFTLIALAGYNYFRFKNLSSDVLLNRSVIVERSQLASKTSTLIKRLIIHPFLRLNYIFFDTVGKKVIWLFFVVILISINFIGVAFFISVFYKTERFIKKTTSDKWKFFYDLPINGNPLSRVNFYVNRGASDIWDDKVDSNKPTDNLNADVYFWDGNKFVYQKLSIIEVLGYFNILQNKVINYNKIKSLLSQKQDKKELINLKTNVCLIIKNIFKSDKLDRTECLDKIINRAIPFVSFPDQKKEENTKKHFPIAFNSAPFNPEKDEFFTKTKGKIIDKEATIDFDIFGYKSQSKFFKIESKSNLKKFFATKPNSQQKIIPIIVNRFFKDKFKKKIGDVFRIATKYRQAMFVENENDTIELKNKNWLYYEKSTDGKIIEKPINDLPYDYQFYQGRFLMNANLDPKKPDKFRIKNLNFNNKALEILEYFDKKTNKWLTYSPYYKTKRKNKDTYFKYINIDNIGLKTKNNFWFPFRYTKETANKIKKETYFSTWIKNKKIFINNKNLEFKNPKNELYQFKIIDIHPSINGPKLYLPQSFLNYQIWNNAFKSKNFADQSQNQLLYFNGRATLSEEIYNVFFNFTLTNKIGFLDLITIRIDQKPLVVGFQSYLEFEYRIKFFRFAFEIIWILILFNLITLISFFGLMIKIIFDIFRKKSVLLRILGYKNWEIALQIFIIMFIPVLIAFIIAAIVTKILFDYFVQFLIDNHQIYIFYISDPWIFVACFGIFLFFWLLLFWSYFRSLNKTQITGFIREM